MSIVWGDGGVRIVWGDAIMIGMDCVGDAWWNAGAVRVGMCAMDGDDSHATWNPKP